MAYDFTAQRLADERERMKYDPMTGCMSPSFKCAVCGKAKKQKGRKRLGASSKHGYACAQCVSDSQ